MSKVKQQSFQLELVFDSLAWKKIRGLKPRLTLAAQTALAALPTTMQPLAQRAQLTVLLTTNGKIQRLNREFRGMDKPTNVLSFPQFSPAELAKMGREKALESSIPVGDIALAYQYVVVEAKNEHKILLNHLIHLIIHGILHLFGYDHLNQRDAGKMEQLEKKLMAGLGLPDPYAPIPAQSAAASRRAR